jgi:hypothetical protein
VSQTLDYGQFDPQRVDAFLREFEAPTQHLLFHLEKRSHTLDERIGNARLSLADKIAVFKRLAPSAQDSRLRARTDERKEWRMERLLLSVAPEDLPLFKCALEYDGDYKDLEEYIFHDSDNKERQERLIEHFQTVPQQIGIKVLSDVDDTMYANLKEPDVRAPHACSIAVRTIFCYNCHTCRRQ